MNVDTDDPEIMCFSRIKSFAVLVKRTSLKDVLTFVYLMEFGEWQY